MHNLLIHIGYPKTGTTWLQKHLFLDAAVGFASPFTRGEIKQRLIEPNTLDFAAEASKKYFYPRLLAANDCRTRQVISLERFAGSIHSGGYDNATLAQRLGTVFPNAKILIVIREQKSILWSAYKQYVNAGGSCSLKGYLQPPHNRFAPLPLFDPNHFRYHRLAGYYVRLFGAANVLVLPYELFTSTPQDFVRQIIDFCELETSEEGLKKLPYTKRENAALSSFSVFIKRRTNILFTQKGHLNPWVLYPIISRKKSKHLFYALDRVLPQKIKSMFDQASQETIAAIAGDRYRESNSLISEMFNLDLAQYGYELRSKEKMTL